MGIYEGSFQLIQRCRQEIIDDLSLVLCGNISQSAAIFAATCTESLIEVWFRIRRELSGPTQFSSNCLLSIERSSH